ncbi:MAG: hypothetical protein A3J46_03810 [Candidatus Yanofskybacteria bacterium RIFCSPHIGHO2_02_FULL_41_11]|uniref:Uncharacterized protein n=2 Tax=Candidatus Yanofskyibacteriota TaxID=1752733 RepID=A0A1F8F5X7_9BACT|nr:MAG: hypothetical protein A2817_01015 [Candidatus Yanofskybacteria bacterium RIFCSPHIGHO2_01_FULL_39_8b]OGN08551.1 MAG: hypothetical protein A3J46_03810 [Candidatus Yanofskybacteria bacterium RIFCSPHIGHO2_02_FULL_41_11]
MWLRKLKRMLDEVPREFLEPKYLEEPPPSDQKPLGQLNEEEKRLWGVVRWLENKINLEENAHQTLHNYPNHNSKDCLNYTINRYLSGVNLDYVYGILVLSLKERLVLPECQFFIHGNDIYSFPDRAINEMRLQFEDQKMIGDEAQDHIFNDLFSPVDRNKMH